MVEFGTVDRDILGGFDSYSDPVAMDAQDLDGDGAPDGDAFILVAAENQHVRFLEVCESFNACDDTRIGMGVNGGFGIFSSFLENLKMRRLGEDVVSETQVGLSGGDFVHGDFFSVSFL